MTATLVMFTADPDWQPVVRDLEVAAGETLQLELVAALPAGTDTLTSVVFTARVDPGDSDTAATTVQRTITSGSAAPEGITLVAGTTNEYTVVIAPVAADATKLAQGCTGYDVRCIGTVGGVASFTRVVQRGAVIPSASTTGVTGQ